MFKINCEKGCQTPELLGPEDVKIAYLSRVQKILNAYRDEKN